ncbi:MAG: hypothetical protein M0Q12_10905, partial [Synergistaceae bacterium]|nr:hypothetical protein [Synergistaceae bacterium]
MLKLPVPSTPFAYNPSRSHPREKYGWHYWPGVGFLFVSLDRYQIFNAPIFSFVYWAGIVVVNLHSYPLFLVLHSCLDNRPYGLVWQIGHVLPEALDGMGADVVRLCEPHISNSRNMSAFRTALNARLIALKA